MPIPINVSASRGAAVLGLSKWQTPVSVWLQIMESREPGFCEKNNYELQVFEEIAPFRWGHAFESSIIELAERGITKITDREKLFIKDYLTCHIDGRYELSENSIVLHEGKTANFLTYRNSYGEPGTDQIPQDYQIQCHHQMMCTGAEKVILSVLVFPKMVEEWENDGWKINVDGVGNYYLNKTGHFVNSIPCKCWAETLNQMGFFHQYEITSNPELQEKMINHYSDFWNNCVLTGTPPEFKTYDDIKALCRNPVGTIIADDRIERLAVEYKNIGSEISGTGPLAKRRDEVKVEILKYMNEAEHIEDDESTAKWILRGQSGEKLVSYSRDKNGKFIFR